MELISRISKGTKMDQIYIPKNRAGLEIGNYVIVKPLSEEIEKPADENLYFHKVKELEPIKVQIIKEIIQIINKSTKSIDNIIITGSFLERGFSFNDIDIIVITESKPNSEQIKEEIYRKTGIKSDILILSNKELIKGLETDPLYQMMLSKCIAKKRFIYKTKPFINYKLLDIHLLKSKTLINNFETLNGKEKYDLTRNLIAIYLYLGKKELSAEAVNKGIKAVFGIDAKEIKDNTIKKRPYTRRYNKLYNKTFKIIIKGINNDSKQKQTN